ncbi:Formate dehydrogenase -O, gamma subunit [Candidatus Burkholderia verschuerenii]|uniref:Formate dehydrogenase-O, gamma subunit n=1 Tax=Candidatus Burkholderia verschuerenii TaxID=242163 RepID=A0A0L0MBZ5_9BURK|nr:MliC family protein [Candidatus Burkholderia verschuerenii]KND59780.1 Formate dehydrogenase -O, gamma subunit [Candidatus Burkholderia verschuerenii]
MKRILTASAAVACVASAAAHTAFAMPLTVPQIQTASKETTTYDCKGGKSVSVQYTNTRNHQSFAALTVDERKLLSVNVIAGSGAKYVADQYTWWTKGPEANLYDEMAAKDSPPLLAECQARGK